MRITKWPILNNDGIVGIAKAESIEEVQALSLNQFFQDRWILGDWGQMGPGLVYSPELSEISMEFLKYFTLTKGYYHVLILSSDKWTDDQKRTTALAKFKSKLKETVIPYGVKILTLRENMDKLTDLSDKTITTATTSGESDTERTAMGDSTVTGSSMSDASSLSKFNDTRGAGQNANLTSDMFLTNSTRDTGESMSDTIQSSEDLNTALDESTYSNQADSEVIRNAYLDKYMKFQSAITDLFREWSEEFNDILTVLD